MMENAIRCENYISNEQTVQAKLEKHQKSISKTFQILKFSKLAGIVQALQIDLKWLKDNW